MDKPIPPQTERQRKLAHRNVEDRRWALEIIKQLTPKHNMEVLKHQEQLAKVKKD